MMTMKLRSHLRKDCESAISGVDTASGSCPDSNLTIAKLGTGSKIPMKRLLSWIEEKLQRNRRVWLRLCLHLLWEAARQKLVWENDLSCLLESGPAVNLYLFSCFLFDFSANFDRVSPGACLSLFGFSHTRATRRSVRAGWMEW